MLRYVYLLQEVVVMLFFKQRTAYEMRISDWSSDVCSSDLDDLPFGGVGASGMGSYHGLEGLRTFSHAKGVFDQKKWNAGNLLRPPFGGLANFVMKMMLR